MFSEESTYFIAEAGVNHNGDINMAEALIDAAADAGADAVKFQTFSTDRLVVTGAETADYQQEQTGETETQQDLLRQYELTENEHVHLQSYAADRGITFLSTPFDEESATFLDDIGVPAIKVGSGELDNKPLLTHISSLGRPMVVSTGMGTMAEVERACEWIWETNQDIDLSLLHCTSAYPTPLSEANLRAMKTMANRFDVPVGYSDHTTAVETPAMAVAAGAQIVEKHFTLDRSLPGPDHETSLTPDELRRAVDLASDARVALGRAEKRPTPSERENVETIRKGLHASKSIEPGETFTDENVSVQRPATGLSPPHRDALMGSTATVYLQKGDPITADDTDQSI